MKIHPSKLLLLTGALALGGALLAPVLRADDPPASGSAPAVKDSANVGITDVSSGDAAAKKNKKKGRKKKKKNQEQDSSGSTAPAESSAAPAAGSGS